MTTLTDFETKLTAAASAHQLPDMVVDDAAQLGNFETQGIVLQIDKTKHHRHRPAHRPVPGTRPPT